MARRAETGQPAAKAKRVGDLSVEELEAIITRVVNRELVGWIEYAVERIADIVDPDPEAFNPEFAEGLRHAIEEAEAGKGISLETIERELGPR